MNEKALIEYVKFLADQRAQLEFQLIMERVKKENDKPDKPSEGQDASPA